MPTNQSTQLRTDDSTQQTTVLAAIESAYITAICGAQYGTQQLAVRSTIVTAK